METASGPESVQGTRKLIFLLEVWKQFTQYIDTSVDAVNLPS